MYIIIGTISGSITTIHPRKHLIINFLGCSVNNLGLDITHVAVTARLGGICGKIVHYLSYDL